MSFGRVIEKDVLSEDLKITLLDFICYKNSKYALHELRNWMGDESLLEMLNLFAGSYLTLPSGKRLLKLYYDFQAAIAIKKIQIARRNHDLSGWTQQETILQYVAKKTKCKYSWVYFRGKRVLKELQKVSDWVKKMKIWNRKFLEDSRGAQ